MGVFIDSERLLVLLDMDRMFPKLKKPPQLVLRNTAKAGIAGAGLTRSLLFRKAICRKYQGLRDIRFNFN